GIDVLPLQIVVVVARLRRVARAVAPVHVHGPGTAAGVAVRSQLEGEGGVAFRGQLIFGGGQGPAAGEQADDVVVVKADGARRGDDVRLGAEDGVDAAAGAEVDRAGERRGVERVVAVAA